MDCNKKVIFAVAGSGKTTLLIETLTLDRRFLLITYTENNENNLRKRIIEKFGFFPDNIRLYTYFSFLLSFCMRPFVVDQISKIEGLIFDSKKVPRYAKGLDRYVSGEWAYYSRGFDFACRHIGFPKIRSRLERFYDCILIDEVQDFAGYDFDFIEMLGSVNINVLLVGDFFQHTFDTSRDGTKNNHLHDDYKEYKKRFERNYSVDECSLSVTHRCSPEVCAFVSEKLQINMSSSKTSSEQQIPALIFDSNAIQSIMNSNDIKKLFYRQSKDYSCNATNWGDCKGLTFGDVCVVLNKTTCNSFRSGDFSSLAPTTKNKFYVACTRASGKLFFVAEEDVGRYKCQ